MPSETKVIYRLTLNGHPNINKVDLLSFESAEHEALGWLDQGYMSTIDRIETTRVAVCPWGAVRCYRLPLPPPPGREEAADG